MCEGVTLGWFQLCDEKGCLCYATILLHGRFDDKRFYLIRLLYWGGGHLTLKIWSTDTHWDCTSCGLSAWGIISRAPMQKGKTTMFNHSNQKTNLS